MAGYGRVLACALAIVALAVSTQSLAWVVSWGASSQRSTVPTMFGEKPIQATQPNLVGTSLVAAASAVAVVFAFSRAQRRSAPTCSAVKLVAMETGGQAKLCPRTGGPICYCSSRQQSATLAGSTPTSSSSLSSRSSAVQQRALYPGTDVEIVSEGVTFPITATVEVGEAGKSCTGEETTTGVTGKITMTQTDAENITIEYEVKGLAPGDHGFHVHEKADFSNGCASAGPHYNPFGRTHGGPDDEERHVGDLGNITAGEDGVAKGTITDKLIKVFGEYTVVGRSIMIHADPDDLGRGPLEGWPEVPPPPAPAQHTKTTGNAGARIACGVILAA